MRYYAGWALDPTVREVVLGMAPPMFEEVRCEHVTFQLVPQGSPPPPKVSIIVRGMFYDEQAQALLVEVNGVVLRPGDGLPFHLVVSHIRSLPSAFVGTLIAARTDRVKQVSPVYLPGCVPFVRSIDG